MADEAPIPVKILWKTYALQSKAGYVAEASERTDIDVRTSGGGGTSFDGTGIQQSVQTEVIKTNYKKVYLTDEDGKDTVMNFTNFNLECRAGHHLSAAYISPSKGENKWVAVFNHNTDTLHYNDNAIEQYTHSWILGGLVFLGVFVMLFLIFAMIIEWNAILVLIGALLLAAMAVGALQGYLAARFQYSDAMNHMVKRLKSEGGPPTSVGVA